MAVRRQVQCVNKANRYDPHERITHIGGRDWDKAWRLSQQEAIRRIESRQENFYVVKNGEKVNVIVATSRFGHKYLKTEADGEMPNNLLSLPECSA